MKIYRIIPLLLMASLFLSSCNSSEDAKNSIDDEEPDSQVVASTDLDTDKAKMWKLVEMQTVDDTGDVTYFVSPVSAINAAARVMEAEKKNLIGLKTEEVLLLLKHDPNHRKGSYNFPFWPLNENEKAIVFRFDCGRFGWQFDLLMDENDNVVEVRRQWIH